MSEKNGRHKTPRTTSHVPQDATTPDEVDGSAPVAEDASAGRTEPQIEPAVSTVSNGRTPDGRFGPEESLRQGESERPADATSCRMQFLDAIDPRTLPALARKLQAQALQGDMDCDQAPDRPHAGPSRSGGGPDRRATADRWAFNFHQVTAIVLDALADDPAKRIEVAAQLMELDDARDAQP